MGFKKPDLNDAYASVNRAFIEVNSPYNEGYTSWYVKQDLYNLYFHLKKSLKNTPTFVDEDAWLEEHYKNEMWEELKK